MARLFEIHDTSKFEIYAFSYGENMNDSMRVRIKNAFEHFYEVSEFS